MSRDRLYLLHVRDACEKIAGCVERGHDAFLTEYPLRDSIVLQVEVIGEAIKRLSTSYREEHPQVAWQRWARTRDLFIHQYAGLDIDLIWQIARDKVPPLRQQIAALISEYEES